jgi:hypothetical protein
LNVPTLPLIHQVGALALRIPEIWASAVPASIASAQKPNRKNRFINSPLIVLRLSLGVR